jgi:hypothetical protein
MTTPSAPAGSAPVPVATLPAPRAADGGWREYLDALEAVADGLEAALAAADADERDDAPSGTWVPTVPDVAVPFPAGPPPGGSQERREQLLSRLVLLTGRLQRRQDDVAHQLAALPQRRPRGAERYAGALGATVDLQG